MTIETEIWMIALPLACAAVPWAMSIHAKVAVIASAVESLPQVVEELRQALEEHELRLDEHAEEIKTLKEKTSPSG